MRLALLSGAALLAASIAPARADTQTYRIDPVHSSVVFNVDHNGFSRSFGRLRITDGTLRFDPDHWADASVDATIDLASVDMGDTAWDKVVRGDRLLDADHAGTAHFTSTSVEKRADDEGVLHCRLTMRGVTLPLDIPFRANRLGKTIYGMHTIAGFSGNTVLDRTKFGMTSNTGSVGTQVSVWLEIEAIRGGNATDTTKDTSNAPAQ